MEVGILRQVIINEPHNIPAYYYLGQSIRSLIEKETLVEVSIKNIFGKWCTNGHEEELWYFLKAIEAKKQVVKVQ